MHKYIYTLFVLTLILNHELRSGWPTFPEPSCHHIAPVLLQQYWAHWHCIRVPSQVNGREAAMVCPRLSSWVKWGSWAHHPDFPRLDLWKSMPSHTN